MIRTRWRRSTWAIIRYLPRFDNPTVTNLFSSAEWSGPESCGTEQIAKHASGLRKGNFVFAEILGRFARIPLELHKPSVAG